MIFKRSQEFIAKYEKNPDNSYTCTFKIISPTEAKAIFEIKMQFSSRKSAIDATEKWKQKAPDIYGSVFDILGD